MPHRVELAPAAQRDLRRLPPSVVDRLAPAIAGLADEPRPPGVRKIQGADHAYRLRVGDYRVIYEVHDRAATVVVLRVARRSEATYRRI